VIYGEVVFVRPHLGHGLFDRASLRSPLRGKCHLGRMPLGRAILLFYTNTA
jgi:hypothetical protein